MKQNKLKQSFVSSSKEWRQELLIKAGGRSLFLGTPNVFRLQYRTANDEIIEGVNRIKPCAITGTAVNYTPDGVWSAYDRGQPVSTVLTIRMSELEPVYASDYSENVIESRSDQPTDPNLLVHLQILIRYLCRYPKVMEIFIQLDQRR